MKYLRKHFLKALVAVIVITGIIAATNPSERYFQIAKNLDIFATLFKEVNALYVDEINPNKTIKTGIDAMLSSLDPYTNYIPEDDIEDYRTQSTGQYGGIGAVTTRMDGKVVVSMIMEGFSAEKEGLKIGDEVIAIDGIDITEMSSEATSELMKGQANTEVSLTVNRFGEEEPIVLQFKREKVKINNVPFFGMVSEDVGVVKLTEFTPAAGKSVKDAVEELKKEGAAKIILDLRSNPGGLLLEAVNVTNVFIPKGKEVVSTIGKIEENNNTYNTLNNPVDTDIPVAVLINSSSASASEIVAGTLQDYDRAVIIGRKSFGKGLVQTTRPLSYNAQLKVTTAKYYTPSGRCIQALDYSHRNPDGSVGKVPDSLKQEFRTSRNRIVYDGGGIDPDVEVENEDTPEVAYTLFVNGYIFNYATQYYYTHPNIAPAKDFKLSDSEYEEFKKWLSDKDYSYTTDVEEYLEQLTDNVKDAKYYSDIQDELEDLKGDLQASKATDLEDFKTTIKAMLEDEIVSRYYLQRGAIEASFDNDEDIKAAVDVLNNPARYTEILN